jgi:Cupin-like domain
MAVKTVVNAVQMSIVEWALRSQRRSALATWQRNACRSLVYHSQAQQDLASAASGSRTRNDSLANGPASSEACDQRCEWYYMQADLQRPLLGDVDFSLPAFSWIAAAQHGGAGKRCVSQQPRMWLSTAGATSPMHYDRSDSFLAQVFGTKRMVFVPPSDLPQLQPFPDEHMLARRAHVPVIGDDLDCDALACLRGAEVVLEAGDVVFFGPVWSHWSASETVSCSVICRFAPRHAAAAVA